MLKATEERLSENHYLLFIQSPFCGTCQIAKSMLNQIENVHRQDIFLEMNASLYPEFMQSNQIESVPCLFIKDCGVAKEKIYAFHDTGNIYQYLLQYEQKLFAGRI